MVYPAILQHLQRKEAGSTRSAAWMVSAAAVLEPGSLTGGRDVLGAAGHDREVKSHSHERSRFDGGEGMDETRLAELLSKQTVW